MSLPHDQDISFDALLSVAIDAARKAGAILIECSRSGVRNEAPRSKLRGITELNF